MSSYTIAGRIVHTDGTPVVGADVEIYEILGISNERIRGTKEETDSTGAYSIIWAETTVPSPWDLFVRATYLGEKVESRLISDLVGTAVVDLVFGEGVYEGRSEWDRVAAKIAPHIGTTEPEDIPVDRLEWLARRGDVFPTHLAAYIQAHRLADGHTIKPQSCYAFLRGGLPADMHGLVAAGEAAWEGALRDAWARLLLPLPGTGSPEDLDQEVAVELAAMRELQIDAAVAEPASGVNSRVIFDTAGFEVAEQRVFAELWLDHSGPIENFWAAVTGSSLSAEVPLLRFTVQAATLVGAHVDTLSALQHERNEETIATMADTAAWSVGDWQDLVDTITPPDDVPGEDLTEQRQNYARGLFNIVEDAYPTASVRASIDRDEQATSAPPHTEHLVTFLTNNPEFDLVETTIGRYLNDATSPWTGIDPGDQDDARANLEAVQRVYRLTPPIGRYATAKVLLAQGITSAMQVMESTRSEFVAEFASLLPADDHEPAALAGAIWDNAAGIHALTVGASSQLALAKTNADFVPIHIHGAEQFEDDQNGLAELATILGSLDYCACEHCRSVFSPAAYLTDLLAFLKKRPAEEAAHALELLLERRPDLAHILLDCANTNTVLPYIDLVNELLEAMISGEGSLAASSKQTTWTAAELRLHPEHLDASVYEGATMTQTVHPWTLPFSLPTVEAQTYLRHLGVPRHELMRRVAPLDPGDELLDAMAGDVLGLNATEFAIIAGLYEGNTSEDGREYWGFEAGSATDNWAAVLNGTDAQGHVGELLLRTSPQLDRLLDDLRDLLAHDFIDSEGDIEIQWSETCSFDDVTIPQLDEPALDRLHRFVRLQRASAIPGRMLNLLLRDTLGGTLDRTALRKLAEIARLRDRLRLAWDEVATFWADVIDPRDYEHGAGALYTRRFLGKDLGSVDPDFIPAGDGTLDGELSPAEPITDEQLPRVLAGLGIKERDFRLLAGSDLANDDFSFANLTALFRCVVLARALRIPIADLVRLAGTTTGLTTLDPFASPAATLAFVDQVHAIRDSGFSIDELDWLLRHEFRGPDPLDTAAIGRALAELARALERIEAEAGRLEDPDGHALATNLAALLDAGDVETTIEIVEDTTALTDEQQETFLETTFATILDVEAAKQVLVDDQHDDSLADVALRRAWLLGKVVGHLRRRALVIDTITSKFGIPATVAEALVMSVLTDPDGSDPLFEVYRRPFATEEQVVAGLTPLTHANEFAAWTRVAKAALVCARFRLRADQVVWYSGRGDWLDLDALPLDDAGTDASFESWERLRRALALRSLSRPGELAPALIAETSTLSAAIEILAEHAGWDADAVLAVATALGYGDGDAAAVAEETIPERLRVIVETGDRLGVALELLFDWAAPTPTMANTAAIKAATRAHYGEDRWPNVAKPLRDAIRERQRDALVDAVLSITPARLPNDVFEYLLIDVEMSACMMTSRIRQALASVQIFVHRVLLHLEDGKITFDPEAIMRWGWMKNYRVWEANRKVFLYPENWIQPELRGDKTPEFENLEADLMQGVLDQRSVEKALGEYLEQLARVANLEIIGVQREPLTSDVWILARTHATPHEWFIRRRLPSKQWEPWESVPHAIDSDAVVIVPVVGRLHLFWATEEEVAVSEVRTSFKFRIGHLERGRDGWGKPTMSKPGPMQHLPEHKYRLHYTVLPGVIRLTILWHPASLADGTVGCAASFVFTSPERHIEPTQNWLHHLTYTDITEFDDIVVTHHFLEDSRDVGFAKIHTFDGQRNRKKFYYAVDISGWEPMAADLLQGTLNLQVFERPSMGMPTFVHQANILVPSASPNYYPAVYDDRRHKYLLEPGLSLVINDANPGNIATFTPSAYFACPAVAEFEPLQPSSREAEVQKVRDRITERQPWSTTAAPGQHANLVTLELDDNPHYKPYNYALLLNQSNELATAALDFEVDTPTYPIAKSGVVLDMVELHHPFVHELQNVLGMWGVRGLYAPPVTHPLFRQLKSDDPFREDRMGLDTDLVRGRRPIDEFNFDVTSPYGTYNWEIFYHVPMLIAKKLTTEQRWETAQAWYHLIFNPIDIVDLPWETHQSKFWRIKPFYEQATILARDQFQEMLGIGVTKDEQKAAIKRFADQVAAWEANPFDPHAVARVRPGVYQRALLREYFDNLIAWADHLFRRDTMESITEATVLYIVVAQLLGDRPTELPAPDGDAKSFAELDALGLDPFSNAMIKLENWIHPTSQPIAKQGCGETLEPRFRVPVVSRSWYFCYPPNPELLKYWDIIADRLFKIRHCQNIEGVERQLPLFEPPIDPALLVAAAAAGVDIQSVLAELDSGLPPYRFRSVHARAVAFANSLRSLGQSLLSALEKQDAEELSRIRSGHELEMLARVRDVRAKQIEEVEASLASLEAAREGTVQRLMHYSRLIQGRLSREEQQQFDSGEKAHRNRQRAAGLQGIATIVSALAQINIIPPSAQFGGIQLSNVMNAIAAGFSYRAAEHDYAAGKAGMTAGFARRAEDWSLQLQQAELEAERIDKDIIAAKIRLALAERELDNHDTQARHALAVDEYMRTKFTNRELYDWMIAQLSTLYFDTYQLAFDLAKRAERAYRHELAVSTSEPSIIKFGYWDSLRKGLLAGERLGHDLERLDLAYMDRDVREFELRKSISLAELDPDQLHELRETGQCTFGVPEVLFDLDHPGHYLRRIRSVRITIPAVVGPYTSLGASLQLLSHKTRVDKATGGYAEDPVGEDTRFRYGTGAGQSIATSTAMSDGGLFNLDFKDERYLPFEYTGAISTWKLELPGEVRQFDYRTIEDVVIHIDYTARQGGGQLRGEAEGHLAAAFNSIHGEDQPLALLVSVHDAFPNEWERFFTVVEDEHVLTLPIVAEHFPYFARHNGFEITKVGVVLLLDPGLAGESISPIEADLDLEESAQNIVKGENEAFMTATFTLAAAVAPGTWTLTIADSEIPAELQSGGNLDPDKVVGLALVLHYTLDPVTP
jgi:hypothetical protein